MLFRRVFCGTLGACLLGLTAVGCSSVDAPLVAPAPSGPMAEVLGVYFTPPAGAAAAIVKAIDASEHEVLV